MLRTRKNKKEVEEEARLVIISRVLHLCAESERDRGIECYNSEQGEVGTINNLVTGVESVLDGESLLTSRSPF